MLGNKGSVAKMEQFGDSCMLALIFLCFLQNYFNRIIYNFSSRINSCVHIPLVKPTLSHALYPLYVFEHDSLFAVRKNPDK